MTRDPFVRPQDYRPPVAAEELRARYAAGERYFEETDLPDDSDLRGAVLAGANFRRSWFFGADFTGADLRGATFDESNVKCLMLVDVDLRDAHFRDCVLCGTTVRNAAAENVDVRGATYYGAAVADIRDLTVET
jgi:uncharacterized protein YjbI with pentapeptide repeats